MIAQTYTPSAESSTELERKRTLETGFPSPATDHLEDRLNLNDFIVKRPASTFYMRVRGDENQRLGLKNGDILVIDRSLAPRHDCLVLAVLDGEFRVCRLLENKGEWYARTGEGTTEKIQFDDQQQAEIWGRVTHVIHSCI